MTQQKLDYIQKLLETYRNETMDYANIVKDFQKDYEKINTLFEDQDKLEKLVETHEKDFKKHLSLQSESLKDVEYHLRLSKDTLVKLEGIVDILKESDISMCAEFNHLNLSLKLEDERINHIDGLVNTCYEALQQNKVTFDSFQKEVLLDLINLKSRDKENSQALEQIKSELESKIEILEENLKLNAPFIKSVESTVSANQSILVNELRVLSSRVKKIEDTEAKEVPVDSTKEELEALKKQFNAIQIDLQNNNLKSANSSTQFHIIEKKIENIYLILKKIELGTK